MAGRSQICPLKAVPGLPTSWPVLSSPISTDVQLPAPPPHFLISSFSCTLT